MSNTGVAAAALASPEKIAIVAGSRRISYSELDRNSNRAARLLLSVGVQTGDVVALAIPNKPEFFEAATACARIGAFVVPIPWRSKQDEISYLVSDSKATVLIASANTELPAVSLPTFVTPGTYETQRDAQDSTSVNDEPAAPAFRYYTSGTTGRPKAVVREGVPDPVRTAMTLTEFWGVASEVDVHLVCGPLYHTAPCAYANYALTRGQTVVLLDHFDAEECLRSIEAEHVTWSHMVPINFIRILRSGINTDTSSVRRIIHAAAPCPVEVKRKIMNVFPPNTVWEYYGMTEGFATVIPPEEWIHKPGSVGKPMPGVTLTVRSEDGSALPPREVGLVYVTPSNQRRFEYGGDQDKTDRAWLGDQFTVGDMGYLDEDGYLFLTDRKQDLIITGGANVYPAEVEATLYQHPFVQDVAVIGIPDDEFGERVHAIVEGSVAPQELIDWCRKRLAHYKCPRSVEVVEKLPRDENGKVRKRELREPYWAGRATRI
ncbi:MAG: AMP-binding protein [Actinomycetota bacterium]